MNQRPVIIAGGGIGGMALALTLHQIGVPCLVLASVADLKPLGVGVNLQPNAVRELYELEIGPEMLDEIGVQTKEWALVGLNADLQAGPRHGPRDDQLDCGDHRRQLERLDRGRLEQESRDRSVHPSFRRLDLRMVGRARHAARRGPAVGMTRAAGTSS